MVLESSVICIDNSEHMRNGDYMPTRMQAQQEAANVLIQCKLRSNPESNVALLPMAPSANVVTGGLTRESNKLVTKLHQIQIQGFSSFFVGVQAAQLVLKHRPNRSSQSRIIVFVGSPIEESESDLVRLAKQFKKTRYFVDIILFGDVNENQAKLEAFISTLNGNEDHSHIIVVPPGSNLSEALVQSSILQGESGEGAAMAAMAGGAGGFDFGVDAAEDPELALALRVSLEEERQRAQQQAQREGGGAATAADSTAAPTAVQPTVAAAAEPNFEAMTEEEMVEYAMRMSMAQDAAPKVTASASNVTPAAKTVPVAEAMDTSPAGPSKTTAKADEKAAMPATDDGNKDAQINAIMSDPQALEQLISTLPGVDPKSQAFQKAKEQKEKEDKEKKTCKNEEKK